MLIKIFLFSIARIINNRKLFKCKLKRNKFRTIFPLTSTPSYNLWYMISSKKDQLTLLNMLSNGSLNGLPKNKPSTLELNQTQKMMMLNRSHSTTQNYKRKSFKEKPEAEWEFQKKYSEISIKNKAFNSRVYQKRKEPDNWF